MKLFKGGALKSDRGKIWQLDTILLGLAGILLRNYLVNEAGAKKGATAVIHVFIVCLDASALKITKPVPA